MSATPVYAAIAAVAAAALAGMEWRGPGRLRAGRVLAVIVSVLCLLMMALRPEMPRAGDAAPVTVVTRGTSRATQAADFAIGLTRPGIASAPDLGWIARHRQSSAIRIVGWGVEEDEWPELSPGVDAELSPPPAGVVSIAWPSSITLGDEAVVRGRVGPQLEKTRVVLADGSGTLDSVAVSAQAPWFTLRARPRAIAHWRPVLRIESPGIPAESLAIEVRSAPPLRVLLVESSPSFETRFLRDWLAAEGAEVGTRTRVARGRTRTTGVNAAPTAALTRGTLDGLDVLVVRGATAAALGPTEARAVDEEVRERGLGLVVMTNDTALTAGFGMEVLARDSGGTPTVVVAPAGSGRIARVTVTDVPRKLRGDSAGYAELWSRVLGSVRRRAGAALSIEGEAPRFANRPAVIVARGERAPKELLVESPDGTRDTVYLAATPWDSSTRRGVFWPPRPGWYRVGGAEGTALFAHDTATWMAVQAQRRIEATRARVGPGAGRDTVPTREPMPLWPAFLGFLMAAGCLWWTHLRSTKVSVSQ